MEGRFQEKCQGRKWVQERNKKIERHSKASHTIAMFGHCFDFDFDLIKNFNWNCKIIWEITVLACQFWS